MKENQNITGLLGCGWLGFPLATCLISKGYNVRASTTSPGKLGLMKQAGIDPYLVQFSFSETSPGLDRILDSDLLIISVPPGRRNQDGFEIYGKMISELCERIPRSRVRRVILISSTSVYPHSNGIVNEYSDIFPETASGKLMAGSEALLRAILPDMVILRLAGLVGPGRMPGKFFAGKTGIPGGLAPVNLIHGNDAVRLICSLIEDENARGVFNGCAPSHPGREEFYTLASQAERLPLPEFIPEKTAWKIVSSVRLAEELHFEFEVPSLMDWLKDQHA